MKALKEKLSCTRCNDSTIMNESNAKHSDDLPRKNRV